MKPDQTVEQAPLDTESPLAAVRSESGVTTVTTGASQLELTGREIAIGLFIALTFAGLALAGPLGLSSLLSHYLSNRFPEDAFYSYHNDAEYLKGLDTIMPWCFLLFGYAIGLTRRAAIPALVGIVGFIFLRDHTEIVQAIVAYSAASK